MGYFGVLGLVSEEATLYFVCRGACLEIVAAFFLATLGVFGLASYDTYN